MIKIGLTGSIAMGKSTAGNILKDMGIPVHCSDDASRNIDLNGAFSEKEYPEIYDDGELNRKSLARLIFSNDFEFQKIQNLIHPHVLQSQNKFIKANKDAPIIVLDIPLLFETGAEKRLDFTIVVSAPLEVQRKRALSRDGMDSELFDSILSKQMSDKEKREKADFVLKSDGGIDKMRKDLIEIIDVIKASNK